MRAGKTRGGSAAAVLGAVALFGAGGVALGPGVAAASPARGAAATPAPAASAGRGQAGAVAASGRSEGSASRPGDCMTGAVQGSQASPDIHQGGPVITGLHGYTPQKTSSSTMGTSGNAGPATGGLRPVGSPSWHPRPWTTYTARHRGPSGRTMKGAIEGSQAWPDIHQGGPVITGLHGYTPQKTSSSTMGTSGNAGPATGGLRPVGSPSWHPRPWTTYSAGCPNGTGGSNGSGAYSGGSGASGGSGVYIGT